MSEFSEAYYLRGSQREEGVQLLLRAGLHGFVFPPMQGWIQVLAEGPQAMPNQRLLSANRGILLHYVYADDSGVSIEVYDRNTLRLRFWRDGTGRTDPELAAFDMEKLTEILGQKPSQVEEFHRIAFGKEPGHPTASLAYRLATVLGLKNFEWIDYASFSREFHSEHTSTEVIEVDFLDEAPVPTAPTQATPSERAEPFTLFPEILFGSAPRVKRAARKLVRDAWKEEDWQTPLANLHLIPIGDQSDPILIGPAFSVPTEDGVRLTASARDELWRLNDLSWAFWHAYCDSPEQGTAKGALKYHQLLIQGMTNYFWFSLSLLNCDQSPQFIPYRDSYRYERVCRDVLAGYVRWLPEILRVAPRLQDSARFLLENLSNRPSWSHNILHVAINAGWNCDIDALDGKFKGDFVRAMLEDAVITKVGNRYQLSDSFGV